LVRVWSRAAAAADLGDDLVGGLGPHEGWGVVVVVCDVGLDDGDEVGDAGEASPFESLGGELTEPAFDEIEPR